MSSSVAERSIRLVCANLVEPHARGFDGIERFLLRLERRRPFDRTRERAARDRPMIRLLGALERLEGGRVLALPVKPAREALERILFGRTAALDPESIACVRPFSVSDRFASAPV